MHTKRNAILKYHWVNINFKEKEKWLSMRIYYLKKQRQREYSEK